MRELLTHPNSTTFTQGSIFEGLNVNQDTYTNALVITARCDIANGKARNILCLPIYKASEWLNNQGQEIVFRRVEGKLENKLKEQLKKLGISFNLLSTYPLSTITKLIDSAPPKKGCEDIKQHLNMFMSKKCDYSLKFVSDERKNLSSSLINNTENSIYFLEQIDLDEVLEPYVVDLSEPISIPYTIAAKLLQGIKNRNTDDVINQYLTIYKKEISYISILNSPYIEHILQKFSNFCSRIGTEDIDKELVNILKDKLNEI